MRKFLVLALLLVALISTAMAVGCQPPDNDQDQGDNGGQTCTHEYKDGYFLEETTMYIGKKCKKCNEIDKDGATKVNVNVVVKADDKEKEKIISTAKDGDVVAFTKGSYDTINGKWNTKNIRYIAETGATFRVVNVTDGDVVYENFTITGAGDRNALNITYSVSNITVKNCYFTSHGGIHSDTAIPTNLVVENCTFENIITGSSAMTITQYDGLTVNNCVFKNVGYNALQVGEKNNAGKVYVTNNVFNNMRSRVVYLVRVDNLQECVVEGNVFYDHEHVYSPEEDGPKKPNGAYIHSKSTSGTIKVGVNTWENVPKHETKYIAPIAEYVVENQLTFLPE